MWRGRVSRGGFFWNALFCAVLGGMAYRWIDGFAARGWQSIADAEAGRGGRIAYVEIALLAITCAGPLLLAPASLIARLHDTGRGAIWLVPMIGLPILLAALAGFLAPEAPFAARGAIGAAYAFGAGTLFYLLFVPGTDSPNRYGPPQGSAMDDSAAGS